MEHLPWSTKLPPGTKPTLIKILVSVKFSARNSGAGNGCVNFMGPWQKCALSAGKTHVHKIPRFGGRGFWSIGGEGVPILFLFKGEKPTPKNTHPNKKSLRNQFSGLFVQTVLPLSFKFNKRHAERVWANCLHKLFSVEFIGVGVFGGWAFLP